jgi:two-component system, OmpR family, sensor histidine kinase TctE
LKRPAIEATPHQSPRELTVKPSLSARLVKQVVGPLMLTWALGTAIALSVASYFVAQAFDRSLLDDAYAVAAHVQIDGGQLSLNLTPAEMSTLLFDHSESIYFTVLGAAGELVAGHGGLSPATLPKGAAYGLSNISLHGREMRAVTLRQTLPVDFTVVMAQTSSSRNQMLQQLLVYSATPQLLMLAFLAWWLRRVIQRDLRPLTELQQAVDRRDANDLTPIAPTVKSNSDSREVERLGTAINSLLVRLDDSLGAQREFTGNVAHELRTPLAGIRAQAEYALKQQDPAVWREQLQGIARSEARASHQVDQLLALARADEARTRLNLTSVALNELVRDTVIRFVPRADSAGIDLGALGLETPAMVWADTALVEGLLANLLDNALRYGAAVHARVTVALTQRPEGIALSVIDNGPGISADEARSLLRRGVQGAEGKRLGLGAGLGLSIVNRYAELLGAAFSLGNAAEGPGLCATVVFRRAST